METLLQDVRYAIRSLLRQPSFALTAILTLALGIGATTAMFSVLNAVILRPLAFEDADRIVALQNSWVRTGPTQQISAPDFHDWQARSRSFEAMGYYAGGQLSVTIDKAADYALAFRVTPGFFPTLRARAALGRLLTDEEQAEGGPLAIVLTHDYWRRQFNSDPRVVGKTIKFDDRIFTISGVLEPGIRFPARADFYYPAWVEPETQRSAHNYRAVGRLAEGVTLEQARGEMATISAQLAAEYPSSNEGKVATLVPLKELLVGDMRQTLYVLFGAVAVVLLIACANVANLLLARATVRSREMVVRAAVGASRARLVRQLLTESALLGLVAGLLGVWFARFGVLALTALAPLTFPRLGEVRVDAFALGFALLVALGASILFGLAPALHVSRVRLSEGLRQGGKGASVGARTGMARSAFVVAEVALAVVLVTGAGLLGRSLAALTTVDMGFDPEGLAVVGTVVPVKALEEASRATAFYRQLLGDVRRMPGVAAAGAVRSLPTQAASHGGYFIEGGADPDRPLSVTPTAVLNVISEGYFGTLGVPVGRGRDFTESDDAGAPMVAIINEALARASFGEVDPLGRRIQCGLDSREFMTIVGVVGDVRTDGPDTPAQPEIYMPFEQHPGPSTALSLVLRGSSGNPLALAEPIRRRIASLNADVPMKITTMESTLETAAATPRFRTFLVVAFAAIALVLALAGIYGVMAYSVSQRVPELGVRIALGATPGNILRLVIGHGARLAAIGLVLGVGLALASGRLLEGMLFNVTARDPWSFAAVAVTVALACLAACYIPGRRALRVDPMSALRAE